MPATKAAQDEWINNAVGQYFNPDSAYGFQCKDTIDAYCQTLFGNWQNTVRPGNGKDVFANANPAFFTKILNNWNDPNLIPQRGDIIVYGPSRAVPEGHVAVVESADQFGVTVIQQDGYLQTPAFRARLTYVLPSGAAVIGWLRPKLEAPRALATPQQVIDIFHEYFGPERYVEPGAIDHYTRYTPDFVRADVQGSQEYRDLQARKAQAALERADAEKRAAAEAAERQRLAEEAAAAERLKRQAEEQARAVEAAKQNADAVSKVPVVVPPLNPPLPTTAPRKDEPSRTQKPPVVASALVRFLFAFINLYMKKKKA